MRSYNRTACAFTLCFAAALGMLGMLAAVLDPAVARAQQPAPPTASVLRTSVSGAVDPSLAEAVDRLVRSQLDAAEVLRITGSVSLDLHDVQLALGCIGETDACLEAAAGEIGVDALVLPSLVRTGDETVLSIGLFDRRATPKVRRVTGRVRGADPSTGTLEAVSGLLAQLFPQAHFAADGHGAGGVGGANGGGGHAGGGGAGPGPGHSRGSGGLSPWPFVVGGIGVATLGAGVGFGLAAQSAEDDFAALQTSTAGEIDVFLARVDDARFDATVANVLFVTGGLAVAGGVAWAVIDLTSGGGGEDDVGSGGEEARPRAQLVPVITPGGVGVVVGGVL